MNRIFTLVASFILSANVFPQPAIQWQKCLGGTRGDLANSIQQTSDGGYIVAGASVCNDGDVTGHHGPSDDSLYYDYWVVKLNNNGAIQWEKSLGGTDDDRANSVQQTLDGGYIVAGYSKSNDGDVTGHHNAFLGSDDWIVKLDSSGSILWEKSLGGWDNDHANSIRQTLDKGYIIAGGSRSNNGDVTVNHGNFDVWVVKIDSIGIIQWQKSLGGPSDEDAYDAIQTSDGGYIVAGSSGSSGGDVTVNHGLGDYWIVKLDSGGGMQWQKSLGGTGTEGAKCIQQTTDGGFIIAGYSTSNDGDVSGNHGGVDVWIVKIDSTGAIQWEKSLGGTTYDYGFSIQQVANLGYVFAGGSCSNDGDVIGHHGSVSWFDFWIVQLDSNAGIVWQKSLGGSGSEIANSMQQTLDGGFILAGPSDSTDGDVTGNHGYNDYWVVKLAPYVGIEENSLFSRVNIFPNPATNELIIDNAALRIEEVEIYDVLGQQVFPSPLVPLSLRRGDERGEVINVSSLPSGIYFVKITNTEGNKAAGKFVKM